VVAVHLLLVRDGEVLLLRRANTGYEDGNYSVPAGHVEAGELPRATMIREAMEEVGLLVPMTDLPLALTMARAAEQPRIDFFFEVTDWRGDISNREPEKCDELLWAPLDDLPPNMVPYVRAALEAYRAGEQYAEFA
jgi:8-oxo-dGTP pyrophosphatase MutT (NUDIX family)